MDDSSPRPDLALRMAEMDAAHDDFLRRLAVPRQAADEDLPRLFEEFQRRQYRRAA